MLILPSLLFITPLVEIVIPSFEVLTISEVPLSEPTNPATFIPPSFELFISILPLEVSTLPVWAISKSLFPVFLTNMLPMASPICFIMPAIVSFSPLFSVLMFPPSVFVTFPVSVIVKSPSLLVIVVSPVPSVIVPEILVPSLLSLVILILPFSSFTVPHRFETVQFL